MTKERPIQIYRWTDDESDNEDRWNVVIGFVVTISLGDPTQGMIKKNYPKEWAKYNVWKTRKPTEWSDEEIRKYWGKRGLVLRGRKDGAIFIHVKDGHSLIKILKAIYPLQFTAFLEKKKEG